MKQKRVKEIRQRGAFEDGSIIDFGTHKTIAQQQECRTGNIKFTCLDGPQHVLSAQGFSVSYLGQSNTQSSDGSSDTLFSANCNTITGFG